MATIGTQLTTPEAGWLRIDDTNPNFRYTNMTVYGNVTGDSPAYYNNGVHGSNTGTGVVDFVFYGTKLRILTRYAVDQSSNVQVTIDGTPYTYSAKASGTTYNQVLRFEKTGLPLQKHVVQVKAMDTDWFIWDAIDIDDTGSMVAYIGTVMTTPEAGWRRYDERAPGVSYSGNVVSGTDPSYYLTTYLTPADTTGKISFRFIGTRLRLLGTLAPNGRVIANDTVRVTIDGVAEYTTSYAASTIFQAVFYEKAGLSMGAHTVTIENAVANNYVTLDAIDIDSTGTLGYVPPTNGKLQTRLQDMQVGDFIVCEYTGTSNAIGTFSNLGMSTANEIAIMPPATPTGLFYFIKVDKGLLVADRNVQAYITWDAIFTGKVMTGLSANLAVTPKMTADTMSDGTVTSSSGVYSTNYAWNAFDRAPATSWATSTLPAYLQVKLRQAYTIRSYTLTPTVATEAPKEWQLLGSNDGSSWTVVDYQINQTGWTAQVKRTFTVGNPGNYQYYRVAITSNNGSSYTDIGELGLYEYAEGYIRSLGGGCSFADASGNSTSTDPGSSKYGAWPTNNEWDKYIVASTLNGLITAGDSNVWHWNGIYTWIQDTPISALFASTNRPLRGYALKAFNCSQASTYSADIAGFRPVLQYKEV